MKSFNNIILSPTQLYGEMGKLNEFWTCPTCKQRAKNEEEKNFIKEIGECYSCDHVRGDLI